MFVKGSKIDFAKIRKVLLVQLGDIGDVVWTEPTVRAFRETFPSVEVSVLARSGFGELLVAHPDVHRVFNIAPVKGGILAEITAQSALVGKLRRERFDVVFDLRAGDRGAVMAWLTGAPYRVSLYYAQDIPFWRNSLFTHIVDPPPLETLVQGAAEQTLRIAREFGIDTANRAPRLHVSEEVRRRVSVILQEVGLEGAGRWVSVNPFSRWSYKEWPHERWVPVLNGLWERHRLPAVLVGSPDEFEKTSQLTARLQGPAFNLAGKTTLAELAGVLSLAAFHVGVDSAAPHIAAAVGVPTITLYGPSDWRYWSPPGERHLVVAPPDECAPCFLKGCEGKGWSRCLDEMSVERVSDAVEKMAKGIEPGRTPL
jgi:predicted lipopolysaccharide heptosyltransferase III